MSIISDVLWIVKEAGRRSGDEIILRPGASPDAIRQFEGEIGQQLPEDLRELLLFADGEMDFDEAPGGQSLFFFQRFASLDNMRRAISVGIDTDLQVGAVSHEVGDNPCIPSGRVWQNYWIPIGIGVGFLDLLILDPRPINCAAESLIFLRSEETWCHKPISTTVTHLVRRVRESIVDGIIPFGTTPIDPNQPAS